jgi:uncharacterized protein YkwD
MRLTPLAGAVLTLMLLPAAVLAGPAAKAAIRPKPQGLLTVTASVALGPIAGPPKPVSLRLVRMLDAESRRAGLALLNFEGAKADYRLQGDLNAIEQGGFVKLVYSWQVFNRMGTVVGGNSGSIPVLGKAGVIWSEVNEPVLKTVAAQGIAAVMRHLGPADKTEAPAPAASVSPPAAGVAPAGISSVAAQPDLPEFKTEIDADEALRLVNEYRRSRGLGPLRLHVSLSAAAFALTQDMAGHDRLSHIGPDDADLQKRLKAVGYHYMLAAENVGVGQRSLAELISQWEKDPSQSRTMLLPDAREMGIAYQYRPDTSSQTFWTLVVAAPL